ncbi:peptide/nickel transport system ATP-binding protein [Gracilibacillus orientalis]|uniref:Nickel import system ATP-binding protein NikD n=1 Tax=Gracilibacillus orientalis TaxID=334253 RepID=A0A1I4IM32_9BACI|nr:ATP-binding cassette domain-containing protein [Gracilibacillus orientalis]SFL55325.1 peptide/nickel transport system ATP-binding protein [Gracilibacillus orientalis]
MDTILTVNQLSVFHQNAEHYLLEDIHFSLYRGQVLALVGASGSGKSLLAQSILQLLPDNLRQNGDVLYSDRQVNEHDRGRNIVLIPQSVEALDPLMKVGKQIEGLIQAENPHQVMLDLLAQLGLNADIATRYPFQLSGGQARRVLATIALGSPANVVIADEPTPGLDEEAKYEMIALLKEVQQAGKAILLITHDFDVALQLADQVAVLDQGEIIEVTDVHHFSGDGEKLVHPLTKALWQSLPQNLFIKYAEKT